MVLNYKKILYFLKPVLVLIFVFNFTFSSSQALAVTFTSAQNGSWGDSATWSGVTTDYSTFPVLFSGTYSYLATVANGGKVENASGYDILFTSDPACTLQLSHEIESYNATTGAIVAWVKVPTMNYSTDSVFYVCYGNTGISTDQSTPTTVWDSNYKGVWHLPNGSSLTANDSTGVNNGVVTAATATAGKVDGAASFNGTTAKINAGTNASLDITTQPLTISAWINPTTFGANSKGRIVDKLAGSSTGYFLAVDNSNISNGFSLGFNDTLGSSFASSSTDSITTGIWQYVTAVLKSNIVSFFVNGVEKGSSTMTGSPTTNANQLIIGSRSNDTARAFNGTIDEVRISDTARTEDWVITEYNNQSSPSVFYAVGSEVSGGSPYVYNRSITIDHTKVSFLNRLPTVNDNVVIASGTTVSVPASSSFVTENITIDSGGTLNQGADSSLIYHNDFTNNGTYTPDTNAVLKQELEPDLQSASDTGSSDTDNSTTDDTPTFDIACSAGSTVELVSGADHTVLASGTCENDNNITLTLTSLSVGTYNLYAQESDGDGGRRFLSRVTVAESLDGSTYNDSQKFVATGLDDFTRFVYFDNDQHDIHFVQCTNDDCTTKNNNIIASSVDDLDSPTIVMGSDGFARITYIQNYNELHYIQCTNDTCAAKSDNQVDSIPGNGYYEVGFALNSNDLPSFLYNDYDASIIRFAHCADEACVSVTASDLSAFSYGTPLGVAIAPDGFARAVYADNDPGNDIHFIKCNNVDCTTSTNTISVTGVSNTMYSLDMVLGEDGFGRVVYQVNDSSGSQNYFRCTNDICSTTSTPVQIVELSNGQNSIVMGDDDLPKITFNVSSLTTNNVGVFYLECNDADCATSDVQNIDTLGDYPVSITLGTDGFARILYSDSGNTKLFLSHPEKVVVVVEAPPAATHHGSSGGSFARVNKIIQPPVIPEVCPSGQLFSVATGLPCLTFPQPLNTPTKIVCTITKLLVVRAVGQEVKCLQDKLRDVLKISIISDGMFGPKTKAAVILFQKSRSLVPDGIAGSKTRAALEAIF